MHTGFNLSAPVWLRYPYQRGTDKKNRAVWLRSIWLPCEPTDRIQKMMQIGNEVRFVYKRGLSTFLHFSSWLRGMSMSNIYLSLIGSTHVCTQIILAPIPCARRKNSGSDPKKNGAVRIRSRVHRAFLGYQ